MCKPEDDTENAKYKASERYSFGWSSPRLMYKFKPCTNKEKLHRKRTWIIHTIAFVLRAASKILDVVYYIIQKAKRL